MRFFSNSTSGSSSTNNRQSALSYEAIICQLMPKFKMDCLHCKIIEKVPRPVNSQIC